MEVAELHHIERVFRALAPSGMDRTVEVAVWLRAVQMRRDLVEKPRAYGQSFPCSF